MDVFTKFQEFFNSEIYKLLYDYIYFNMVTYIIFLSLSLLSLYKITQTQKLQTQIQFVNMNIIKVKYTIIPIIFPNVNFIRFDSLTKQINIELYKSLRELLQQIMDVGIVKNNNPYSRLMFNKKWEVQNYQEFQQNIENKKKIRIGCWSWTSQFSYMLILKRCETGNQLFMIMIKYDLNRLFLPLYKQDYQRGTQQNKHQISNEIKKSKCTIYKRANIEIQNYIFNNQNKMNSVNKKQKNILEFQQITIVKQQNQKIELRSSPIHFCPTNYDDADKYKKNFSKSSQYNRIQKSGNLF